MSSIIELVITSIAVYISILFLIVVKISVDCLWGRFWFWWYESLSNIGRVFFYILCLPVSLIITFVILCMKKENRPKYWEVK